MEKRFEEVAGFFKALSDPNRLIIVEMLENGELCACELLEKLHISQSTLSHHMKILCEAEIVNCRREGKWMRYSLSSKGCKEAYRLLSIIAKAPEPCEADKRCCEEAEASE